MKSSQPIRKVQTDKKHGILSRLYRFFCWWLVFSGIYSIFAVCPFCGKVGCPIGAVSASVIGGFFALLMQDWRAFVKFIHNKFFRRN